MPPALAAAAAAAAAAVGPMEPGDCVPAGRVMPPAEDEEAAAPAAVAAAAEGEKPAMRPREDEGGEARQEKRDPERLAKGEVQWRKASSSPSSMSE